jgi:hypothetical protein
MEAPRGPEEQQESGWLPPVAPGTQPGPPPGWRVSPKATETGPDAARGPEPWADPGNPKANVALGLSVAGFGLLWLYFFFASLPVGLAGWILGVQARRKLRSGETRQGATVVDVAIWVGVATVLLSLVVAAFVIAGVLDVFEESEPR